MSRLFNLFGLSLFAVAVSIFAINASAQDKQPSPEDVQKMMEVWNMVKTPGPEHAKLAKLVGNWDFTSKFWMDPKQPPMEEKGSSTEKMILGGRVLMGEATGQMMGAPFNGFGLMGYDNFRKTYWASWSDDMFTGIIVSEGTASADGKVITLLGKMDQPTMNVKDKAVKWVYTFADDNNFKMEGFEGVGTPHEYKSMEITYKRK